MYLSVCPHSLGAQEAGQTPAVVGSDSQTRLSLKPSSARKADGQWMCRRTNTRTQTHSPAQPSPGTPEQGYVESSKASPDPLLPPETTDFCSLGSWPTGQSPERGLCFRKGLSEP